MGGGVHVSQTRNPFFRRGSSGVSICGKAGSGFKTFPGCFGNVVALLFPLIAAGIQEQAIIGDPKGPDPLATFVSSAPTAAGVDLDMPNSKAGSIPLNDGSCGITLGEDILNRWVAAL